MNDINHVFGGDLGFSASGDLAVASADEQVRQRLLRRLLTNPGDYLWQPDYGAGLAQFIGKPATVAAVTTLIRAQLALETAVAASPAPEIAVTLLGDGLDVSIRYSNASGVGQQLAFIVSA